MKNQNKEQLITLKIVFAGQSGVGKTSLLRRQTQQIFSQQRLNTIGVDFKIKKYKIRETQVKAMLWDTAGQQRFRSIQKPYYKGAHALLLCFDLNNQNALSNLQKQISDINGLNLQQCQIYLIGCKSDLEPKVFTDQIIQFSQQKNCMYFQTSSKDNQGVNDCFNYIISDVTQKLQRKKINQPQILNQNLKNINQVQMATFSQKLIKKKCC